MEKSTVKYRIKLLLSICLVALPSVTLAQDVEFSGNDDPSVTTNLGIPLSAPLAPMGDHVGFAWGVDAGVGYNFDRRNALIGEFMWNALYPTNGTLEPIRIALVTSNVSGHGNLFAFTGNYRLELRGKVFGTYFIGGPGWYYRTASLSRRNVRGSNAEGSRCSKDMKQAAPSRRQETNRKGQIPQSMKIAARPARALVVST
jgi:hypothetical protein